jgi:CheY-like chemotaxis protein
VETRRQDFTESTVLDGVTIEPGSWVVLSVTDDGTGMDEATTAHAFEPFFTTKNPNRGSGLGLSTVQSAMTRMGGHATVTSHSGSGSRFTMYLPWSDLIPSVTPAAGVSHSGSEHILLVEHEPEVREVFSQAIAANGYRLTTATNAEAALELGDPALASIDALITDGSLTGMPGIELARRLRATRPELPTILVSGLPPQHIDERVRFVKKPIAPTVLLAELRSLLDGRTSAPARQGPA